MLMDYASRVEPATDLVDVVWPSIPIPGILCVKALIEYFIKLLEDKNMLGILPQPVYVIEGSYLADLMQSLSCTQTKSINVVFERTHGSRQFCHLIFLFW